MKDVFPTLYCPTRSTCGLAFKKERTTVNMCKIIYWRITEIHKRCFRTIKFDVCQKRALVKVIIFVSLFHGKDAFPIDLLQTCCDDGCSIGEFAVGSNRHDGLCGVWSSEYV